MEERRAVILEIDSLGALDTPSFWGYCDSPSEYTDLLIVARNVDKRTNIYKTLEKKGLMNPCMKLKSESDLKKVIAYELKKRSAQIKLDAVDLFIKKMNYFDNEDINLLNVVGYLDACTCVSSIITVDIVERVCPSFEEANVFALTSLIREHNAQELYKQVTIITGKDAIRVLSLLLKDFRVAYKLKYFGSEEISTKRTMFASYPKELLCNCMNIIVSIISGIKNGYYSEDQSLLTACAKIMSAINMYETECIS